MPLAGKQVTITGKMKGDTITVAERQRIIRTASYNQSKGRDRRSRPFTNMVWCADRRNL